MNLKLKKLNYLLRIQPKNFFISVFNVGGCLASCLTFRLFLTLATWLLIKKTSKCFFTIAEEILNGKIHFLCSVYRAQRRSSPLVLYTHVCFWATPFPKYDAYVISFANQTLHNHIVHNACNTFL